LKFPNETLLKGFAGFALTAWEFPQAAKVSIRVTLCDEEFAGTEDETSRHFDSFCRHALCILSLL
jgi:hypothetical protein